MKKTLFSVLILLTFIACSNQEETVSNTDEIAIITTDFGEIQLELYDETPKHKENFLKLAREGYYDSTTFHRIIEGFMIQGGDPNSKDDDVTNDGQGNPGYTIEAEFNNDFVHTKGALAAARLGDQANPEKRSSGSQFYIVQGQPVPSIQLDQILAQRNEVQRQNAIRDYIQAPGQAELLNQLRNYLNAQQVDSAEALVGGIAPEATQNVIPITYTPEQRAAYAEIGGTPFLDGNYTVFGEVICGLSVVDSIAVQDISPGDRPLEDIAMMVRVETFEKSVIESMDINSCN